MQRRHQVGSECDQHGHIMTHQRPTQIVYIDLDGLVVTHVEFISSHFAPPGLIGKPPLSIPATASPFTALPVPFPSARILAVRSPPADLASHIRTVESAPPETSTEDSADHARLWIGPRWADIFLMGREEPRSHSQMFESRPGRGQHMFLMIKDRVGGRQNRRQSEKKTGPKAEREGESAEDEGSNRMRDKNKDHTQG
jgi:hypothetical protein